MAAQLDTITPISDAFANNGEIPLQYTCDGADVSPPLSWQRHPLAKSHVVICEDPDAPGGTFCHWVAFNVPQGTTNLPAGVPTSPILPDGSRQGVNSFGRLGYRGPCPPGGTHRYQFHVYSLDTTLSLPSGSSREQVRHAMQGHVVAYGVLTGRYTRHPYR